MAGVYGTLSGRLLASDYPLFLLTLSNLVHSRDQPIEAKSEL